MPEWDYTVLRGLRLKKRMTTTELGAAVGVTSASVENWERGTNVPSMTYGVRLLAALGCKAGALLRVA